jgi:hypothetical protein
MELIWRDMITTHIEHTQLKIVLLHIKEYKLSEISDHCIIDLLVIPV